MMSQHTLHVPGLGIDHCLKFVDEMWQAPLADEYIFDFRTTRWYPPFGMLYLSAHLKKFSQTRKPSICRAANFDNHTYPAHMGFWKSFNLKHGNDVGVASGSDTYVPITMLDINKIKKEAEANSEAIGVIVQREAGSIAQVLVGDAKSLVFKTLEYAIREIIRNSVEHSQADAVYFCAQAWPTKDEVEVAIYDAGRGIRLGLQDNPNLNFKSDQEAVEKALLPGISGVMYDGVARSPYDFWANSGYGLYMTSRICAEGGAFFIASGNGAIMKSQNQSIVFNQRFEGTALRLKLKMSHVSALDAQLERFHKEGEHLASKISGISPLGASIVSQRTDVFD